MTVLSDQAGSCYRDDRTSAASMQPFASHASTDWVLVTGQPGCGKTTAVKTLVEELRARGASVRGILHRRGAAGGRRVGFDIVTVPDGRRGPLARKGAAGPKVGQYGVDVARASSPPTLGDDDDDTIYVLDEIGRMELKSEALRDARRGVAGAGRALGRRDHGPDLRPPRRVLRPRERDARRRRAQAHEVDARRRHGRAATVAVARFVKPPRQTLASPVTQNASFCVTTRWTSPRRREDAGERAGEVLLVHVGTRRPRDSRPCR